MYIQTAGLFFCFSLFPFLRKLLQHTPDINMAQSLNFFRYLLKCHLTIKVLFDFNILNSILFTILYLLCFSLYHLVPYDLLYILLVNLFIYHFKPDPELNTNFMWGIFCLFFHCHVLKLKIIPVTQVCRKKDVFFLYKKILLHRCKQSWK